MFLNDFFDYCIVMKQMVVEENVQFIDLMEKSFVFFIEKGEEKVYIYFMVLEGINDYMYFIKKGVNEMVKFVVKGIKEFGLLLIELIIKEG